MAWEDRTEEEKVVAIAEEILRDAVDDDHTYVVTSGDGRTRITVTGIVNARIVAKSVKGSIERVD